MSAEKGPLDNALRNEHLEEMDIGKGQILASTHANHVRNANLSHAISQSPIPRWSKKSIQLYFAIFVGFLCACANGYDGSLFSGLLSMPHFQAQFHSGTEGPKVSLIASMYTVGQIVASVPSAILCDRYGRKRGMLFGAFLICTGVIISATATTIAQFVVGRFVLGFGVTIMTVAAPAYTTEIAPPHWRGRCTGLLNCGWFGGSIPAAAVTYGTNYINNGYSWRIPVILQATACLVVIFSVMFIPESPRWLMANGEQQRAIDFLVAYHGNEDPDSPLVALEIAEFQENIANDVNVRNRWWDYRGLFKTHSSRWRILQVILMSVAGQYSGNGLAYFNTVIYAKIGISSVTQQLAYNLVYAVISAAGAFTGAMLSDRMPRRWPLVYGTLACAGWLAVNAGLQGRLAEQNHPAPPGVAKGALATYLLFNFTFMFSYTPLQAVLPSEALETSLRAKGLGLSAIVSGAMGFLNQFAGPIALQNIGYKYVWFFAAFDVFESGVWYFFGVEGQGRTLEELEWVYQQPNPVKASLQIDAQGNGADAEGA